MEDADGGAQNLNKNSLVTSCHVLLQGTLLYPTYSTHTYLTLLYHTYIVKQVPDPQYIQSFDFTICCPVFEEFTAASRSSACSFLQYPQSAVNRDQSRPTQLTVLYNCTLQLSDLIRCLENRRSSYAAL